MKREPRIQVSLTPELFEKIKGEAKKKALSLSTYIRTTLAKKFEQEKKEN